jgi:hypothetical protein
MQRVKDVVKLLAERRLALRGDDKMLRSPTNRNLGILEVISQLDPFYLETHGNGKSKMLTHAYIRTRAHACIHAWGLAGTGRQRQAGRQAERKRREGRKQADRRTDRERRQRSRQGGSVIQKERRKAGRQTLRDPGRQRNRGKQAGREGGRQADKGRGSQAGMLRETEAGKTQKETDAERQACR